MLLTSYGNAGKWYRIGTTRLCCEFPDSENHVDIKRLSYTFPEDKFALDGGCKLLHNFVLVWSQSKGVSSSLKRLNLNHLRRCCNHRGLHGAGLSW